MLIKKVLIYGLKTSINHINILDDGKQNQEAFYKLAQLVYVLWIILDK